MEDDAKADISLFEAETLDQGPVATIKLPIRLRLGIHGNWIPSDEFLD